MLLFCSDRILMVSQYLQDVSIIVAEPTLPWLEYIGDGERQVVEDDMEDDDMLKIHRLGVFDIRVKQELLHVLVALSAVQIKDQPASDSISPPNFQEVEEQR